MRGFVLGAHVVALTLVSQVALAQTAAASSSKSSAMSDDESTTIRVPKVDHRVELALRGGLQFPGEATPKHWDVGKTGVAPTIFGEASLVTHPFFTVGVFSQFSSADYQTYMNESSLSDGRLNMLTGGASLKARLPLSPDFVLRAGFLVGANLEWASGTKNAGGNYSAHGYGMDIAPTVEAAYRVSHAIGISGQFLFVSQPVGSASFDGEPGSSDFKFAPLFALALGVEFYQ